MHVTTQGQNKAQRSGQQEYSENCLERLEIIRK